MKIPAHQFAPERYQALFDDKAMRTLPLFERFGVRPSEGLGGEGGPLAVQMHASKQTHYRMRAEFRLWHERIEGEAGERNTLHYAMFNPEDPKKPITLLNFPIAHESIADLMEPLRAEIEANEVLRQRVFQIEFLTTQTNDTLVTLIYHRPLEDDWLVEAKRLEEKFGVAIIGRSRKQRIVVSKESVQETLDIAGQNFQYQQVENAFSQPNASINEQMIAWVLAQLSRVSECSGQSPKCLLELYCGNGNFTIPLSQKFERVLATEISKSSIRTANFNAELNGVENIEFVRLSGEETSEALAGVRPFRRLSHLDLSEYPFDTVFVDPPRAGLDERTCGFISQFSTIVYISCNPHTLAENLDELSKTHELKAFAFFDQFPYTEHLECGAVLVKKIAS